MPVRAFTQFWPARDISRGKNFGITESSILLQGHPLYTNALGIDAPSGSLMGIGILRDGHGVKN